MYVFFICKIPQMNSQCGNNISFFLKSYQPYHAILISHCEICHSDIYTVCTIHIPLLFIMLFICNHIHPWVHNIAMTNLFCFTHWGRVTHICYSKLTIIGSDNALSPGRRQAIIWTNTGILLIWPLGTNFNEISIEILTFSFIKMRLKVSSAKWRPFCLDLNVLKIVTCRPADAFQGLDAIPAACHEVKYLQLNWKKKGTLRWNLPAIQISCSYLTWMLGHQDSSPGDDLRATCSIRQHVIIMRRICPNGKFATIFPIAYCFEIVMVF